MTQQPVEERTLIIGAGPAGLTAALELGKLGREGVVFEADELVGGISRSVVFQDSRIDIGGHRFFTKVKEVENLWIEILGDDLLTRERMSRIFYRGVFFDYPLKPLNALRGLGLFEAVRVGFSYLYAQAFPIADESTFDAWVSNRFGRRLFEIFFKTYTEKVWGMPCSEISAAWAAQRIKNLDLMVALKNALLGGARGAGRGEVVTSLIEQFLYPRRGPGMMWERCSELAADLGVPTQLSTRAVRVHHDGGADGARSVHAVTVRDQNGERRETGDSLISSMPIGQLIDAMDPPAPAHVREASAGLRYRDFLIIGLIVERDDLFPDNWIYIHAPEVRVGRVQNFKNWSPEMVSSPEISFIGLEYFVDEGDDLWSMDDDDLIRLGGREAELIGLCGADEVRDGIVVRMPKAYPVYDADYEAHVETLRVWLDGFTNLYTIGRNGQHRYNNQDHSMVAGLYAARNLAAGESLDLWSINVEQSYHEEERESERNQAQGGKGGDRMVPGRVERSEEDRVEKMVREAFAQYDAVALGGAVGITASLGLALATAILILTSDEIFVPMLSLLGNYLFGYEVSWPGMAVGMIEAGIGGFVLGWTTAKLINLLIAAFERDLERRLATLTTFEALDEGALN